MKIRIVETPPGPAPEEIRKEWKDIEMVAEIDTGGGIRTSNASDGGYKVTTQEAIQALKNAGKNEAANFWASIPLAESLIFHKDVCIVIED
ncbi:hypothetical protein KC901_00960 [Patescibacteria group bacterium]|nr:hypothetical protein [Patescibacteria group bacterium]